MRWAVVKSGLRKERRKFFTLARVNPISRSTIAPFAIRPEVGTPRVTLAAAPWAENPPIATGP